MTTGTKITCLPCHAVQSLFCYHRADSYFYDSLNGLPSSMLQLTDAHTLYHWMCASSQDASPPPHYHDPSSTSALLLSPVASTQSTSRDNSSSKPETPTCFVQRRRPAPRVLALWFRGRTLGGRISIRLLHRGPVGHLRKNEEPAHDTPGEVPEERSFVGERYCKGR